MALTHTPSDFPGFLGTYGLVNCNSSPNLQSTEFPEVVGQTLTNIWEYCPFLSIPVAITDLVVSILRLRSTNQEATDIQRSCQDSQSLPPAAPSFARLRASDVNVDTDALKDPQKVYESVRRMLIGRIVRAAIAIFPFLGALLLLPLDAVITCARVIKAHLPNQNTGAYNEICYSPPFE